MKTNFLVFLLVISTLFIQIKCFKRDCRGTKPESGSKKTMPIIIKELILRVDKDLDSMIGKDELRRYLDVSGTLPWYLPKGFAVEKIFEALDYDPNDGKISEKELLQREKMVEDNLKYLQKK
jgi:hypothetical protein